ncbi:helix-turn-helix domain-containing protein [Domibacillus robiginosus]|uniref:helix-turn-helix domain-containing protein n=1 Tax=Domibacillus robiginosus TaxID=1071054 RepID=UPI00067C7043|nr:helix-turn-helix transcriptional regulator [Domibacillus robiginosus]
MTLLEQQGSINEYTLKNIKEFLTHEGLKKDRLAKKMGMSSANFYDYLNNKRQGVLDFSIKLAEILGYEDTFFMDENFKLMPFENSDRSFAFSAGNQFTEEGKEGFEHLLKICDLFEIYNLED